MDNETEKIISEQMGKLPKEVLTFLSSSNWDTTASEIGSSHNLSHDELSAFKREVTLVLAGLTHPDEFNEVLEQEVGLEGEALVAVSKEVEDKIFAPVRPALVAFLEKEESESAVIETTEEAPVSPTPTQEEIAPVAATLAPEPARVWEKEPDVAPDNLPTGTETEPLFPPIPEKLSSFGSFPPREGEEPAHPFEEKMKRVFTAGQQSMGDFVIEPAVPATLTQETPAPETQTAAASTPPPVRRVDPYREPIE